MANGALESGKPVDDTPPNQTLYVSNLDLHLKKNDVRDNLYALFSTYGRVLEVTAKKSQKMAGRAHILFADVKSATQAMHACQGVDFFDRELHITYAKTRSKTLDKMTGTYHPPGKPVEAPKLLAQAPATTTSSFIPPPGTVAAQTSGLLPPPGLPTKPNGSAQALATFRPPPGLPPPLQSSDASTSQGTKRAREEESEEEEDAAMEEEEEEEEDGGEMEMSDED